MKKTNDLSEIDIYKDSQLIVQVIGFCDKSIKCKGCYSSFSNNVLNDSKYYSTINTLSCGDVIVLRGGEPTMVESWFEKFISPAIAKGLKVIIESNGFFIGRDDYHELLLKLSNENIFARISFDHSNNPTQEDSSRMLNFANNAVRYGVKFGFYSLGMSKKQINSFIEGTQLEDFSEYFHPLKFYKRISMVKLSGLYLRADGELLKKIIEIRSKNTNEIYNKIAEEYNKKYSKVADYIGEFLKRLPNNAEILDLGCGTGINSNYIKQKGFNVIGVDSSYGMFKIAKKNYPEINFRLSNMRKLKFASNSFDGLFASYSLIHIPKNDLSNVVNNLGKLIKSNGVLYISLQMGRSREVFIKPFKDKGEIFLNVMSFSEIKGILEYNSFTIIFKKTRFPQANEIKFKKLIIIA